MKTFLYFFSLLSIGILFSTPSYGQKTVQDSLVRTAKIQFQATKNKIQFTADAPKLRQIAGAPKAYYSNFWEFGDGHYSTENNPVHTYKDKGEYLVHLSATNNYDDGPPPTSRPKKVRITSVSSTDFDEENTYLLKTHHGFRLLNNREPSPNQEMQLVVSYANSQPYTTQGKLYVFYNEKKYKNDNFDLIDSRAYHGEIEKTEALDIAYNNKISYKDFVLTTGIQTFTKPVIEEKDTIVKHNLPATLKEAKEMYRNFSVWEFDNLQANEKRNLFLSFQTTPEMLKDTTAVISIRSVFVPEKGSDAHQVRTKEMEIVTSHDPNKMAVYNTRVNYRLMRFKRLKYKVRFQNNGEGPARLIKLNVQVPEMLDQSTLKVLDMYPKVPLCPDGKNVQYSCLDTVRIKEGISFQFKNIYLPGSNQKGVHEKDSTKGFVKYSMKFGKHFHKKRSRSQTAIIFDKNEPIITNTATSRFSPGLSVGVRLGYNYFFTEDEKKTIEVPNLAPDQILPDAIQSNTSNSYLMGVTLSPYKSYRWYLQAEATLDRQISTSDYHIQYLGIIAEDTINHVKQTYTSSTKQMNVFVVPASIRYNINSIFGVGAGVQLHARINGTHKETTEKRYYRYNQDLPDELGKEITDKYSNTTTETDLSWKIDDYAPFVDLTIGASRIGPSVGVRYLYPLKTKQEVLEFYAIWKF